MDDGRAAAFKMAENVMKAMSEYDNSTPSAPVKSSPFATSSFAMKRGLASVRRSAQRATPSFPALPRQQRPDHTAMPTPPPPRSRQASHTGPVSAVPSSFTVQDIQTTHRLLAEQWDRQCYRLAQYLDRNWCLLHSLPTNMNIEDEKFERPESAGSLGRMLAEVKYDTTPRAEFKTYFDESAYENDGSTSTSPERHLSIADSPLNGDSEVAQAQTPSKSRPAQSSFKQFLLDSSPDIDDELSGDLKQLRSNDTQESLEEEPDTPRQATVGASHNFSMR